MSRCGSKCRASCVPSRAGEGRGEAAAGAAVAPYRSPRVYRNLDEIFAGECEGMTYEEIQHSFPSEAKMRATDKIGFRYPRGESYLDILARLDPLVHELESYHEPLVVVSHQAVLRLLYCYLTGRTRAQAPKLSMPLHTVI